MNKDRRQIAKMCIELLKECHEIGLIRPESEAALNEAVEHLRSEEYWQEKNQSKWEGKNPGTDSQLSISRVALPALEKASAALVNDDFVEAIMQLTIAMTTNGTSAKTKRSK